VTSLCGETALTALALMNDLEPLADERRRHSRVKVRLPGQFMREDRSEYPCMTIDMSIGGVAFASEQRVEMGERIIAYLPQVGRLEGRAAREFRGGFAIKMKAPALKRERLAEQLTWLANRQDLGMAEDRRHERIKPRKSRTTLILPTGRELIATVVDISQSGVALLLAQPATPAVGTPVTVGATKGRVVRLFAHGVAVEFARVVPDAEFSDDIVL
jgi:PilZ domain